jgi:hypothetical protein
LKYIRIEIPRNRLSSSIEKVYRGIHVLPTPNALEADLDEVRAHRPDQDPSIQTASVFLRFGTNVPVKTALQEGRDEGHNRVQQEIQQNEMLYMPYIAKRTESGSNFLKSYRIYRK